MVNMVVGVCFALILVAFTLCALGGAAFMLAKLWELYKEEW